MKKFWEENLANFRTASARKVALAAGVSFAVLACAPTSNALIAEAGYGDEDAPKVEVKKNKVKEEKKNKIRIVQSANAPKDEKSHRSYTIVSGVKPNIVVSSGWKELSEEEKKQVEAAKKKIDESIKDIKKKLKKADNEFERNALEMAIHSLEASKHSIEMQVFHHLKKEELLEIEIEAISDALIELKENQIEMKDVRIQVNESLAEARLEIQEALGDVDFEIDISEDGDLERIRLRALEQAAASLEGMEEEHLEAIKRAEKELKRTRERLEKELEKKKREAEKAKKKKEKDND